MPELRIVQLQCDIDRCGSVAGTRKFIITVDSAGREVILCPKHAAPVELAMRAGMPVLNGPAVRTQLTEEYLQSRVRRD